MIEHIAWCVAVSYGGTAALVIAGVVVLVRYGGIRLALAAAVRRCGLPLYRWLARGRDHR